MSNRIVKLSEVIELMEGGTFKVVDFLFQGNNYECYGKPHGRKSKVWSYSSSDIECSDIIHFYLNENEHLLRVRLIRSEGLKGDFTIYDTEWSLEDKQRAQAWYESSLRAV